MTTRYFRYIADKISAAKASADSLASGVEHRGIEGEIREIAARNCVEPFLTMSYQCGNGKIIDSLGGLSDQIDLVVYHRKVTPPILVNRDLGLFPVECVKYAFEIKSKLTAPEIRDANKKFSSISSLVSFPRTQGNGSVKGGDLPVTVLFAFSSDISGSEIERYIKHTDNSNPPSIVLCVLGKGYWFYQHDNRIWHGVETSPEMPSHAEFCAFITGFMNTLAAEETSMRPFSPGIYVDTSDIIIKSYRNGID